MHFAKIWSGLFLQKDVINCKPTMANLCCTSILNKHGVFVVSVLLRPQMWRDRH